MKRLFYGRVQIEQATALLEFEKQGITQQLIHNLKYRRQQKISVFLGEWLGAELVESGTFTDIDLVVPVPIHPSRRRKRGYNQVSGFARAIASSLNVECDERTLLKKQPTASQVLKSRLGRYQDDKGFYVSVSKSLVARHILLVDDIITSGATIEACADVLFEAGMAKLSIATMAKA